ncbi:MAG: hypothetical protein IT306_28995 [Chloroflexi bacterium]|nr:hypothetical protein [Chloroflexota bacterium]
MSKRNVISFMRGPASEKDLLNSLKTMNKDEVMSVASELGYPFTDADFDPLIWGLEVKLAARRGEPFDQRFPLWQTMWGQYYFEYLVLDLLPALTKDEIEAAVA